MDWTHGHPYEVVRARAFHALSEAERGSVDHRAFVPFWARSLATHTQASRTRGEPCDDCGQEWPCSVYQHILSPD